MYFSSVRRRLALIGAVYKSDLRCIPYDYRTRGSDLVSSFNLKITFEKGNAPCIGGENWLRKTDISVNRA
jgi:hypothetical protein